MATPGVAAPLACLAPACIVRVRTRREGLKKPRTTVMSASAATSKGKSKAAGTEVAAAREQLRELKKSVENNKSTYTSTSSSKLGEVIDTCNSLYEVGKEDARHAALDASFLNTTSMLGAEQAGNLEKVTPEKYISRLKAEYGFGGGQGGAKAIKWQQLATDLLDAGVFFAVPSPAFLVGKFEAPEKRQRKEREKKDKEGPSEPMEMANSVDVNQLQENHKDKAQVVRIRVLLEAIKKACAESHANGQSKRVNLFHVLLNPESFSQTVENFFDLSFVLKEGQVKLVVDEATKTPYLQRSKRPGPDDYASGLVRKQNILKLDVPTWRALTKKWCGPGQPRYLAAREARPDGPDAGEEDEEDDEEDEDEDEDDEDEVVAATNTKRQRAS